MSTGLPQRTYLVCATHRSGSNLLCQALWHTGKAGYPQEALSPTRSAPIAREHGVPYDPQKQFAVYFSTLMRLRQSPNRIFGAKLMWSHVDWFMDRLKADQAWPGPGDATPAETLNMLLPDLAMIWMRRRDKVRQAISLVKAKQTKLYNSMQEEEKEAVSEPEFDFEAIRKEVNRLHEDDLAWQEFFDASPWTPHEVVYEDFVEDYDGTIRGVLALLGVRTPDDYHAPATNYRRQSDEVNDAWFARYEKQAGS